MQTREGALRGAPGRAQPLRAQRPFGPMRQATLTALTALAGCLVLIAIGAMMSICWAVHPLLTVAAGIAVSWLASRVIGYSLRSGGRS